jgi:hypothetical protein
MANLLKKLIPKTFLSIIHLSAKELFGTSDNTMEAPNRPSLFWTPLIM